MTLRELWNHPMTGEALYLHSQGRRLLGPRSLLVLSSLLALIGFGVDFYVCLASPRAPSTLLTAWALAPLLAGIVVLVGVTQDPRVRAEERHTVVRPHIVLGGIIVGAMVRSACMAGPMLVGFVAAAIRSDVPSATIAAHVALAVGTLAWLAVVINATSYATRPGRFLGNRRVDFHPSEAVLVFSLFELFAYTMLLNLGDPAVEANGAIPQALALLLAGLIQLPLHGAGFTGSASFVCAAFVVQAATGALIFIGACRGADPRSDGTSTRRQALGVVGVLVALSPLSMLVPGGSSTAASALERVDATVVFAACLVVLSVTRATSDAWLGVVAGRRSLRAVSLVSTAATLGALLVVSSVAVAALKGSALPTAVAAPIAQALLLLGFACAIDAEALSPPGRRLLPLGAILLVTLALPAAFAFALDDLDVMRWSLPLALDDTLNPAATPAAGARSLFVSATVLLIAASARAFALADTRRRGTLALAPPSLTPIERDLSSVLVQATRLANPIIRSAWHRFARGFMVPLCAASAAGASIWLVYVFGPGAPDDALALMGSCTIISVAVMLPLATLIRLWRAIKDDSFTNDGFSGLPIRRFVWGYLAASIGPALAMLGPLTVAVLAAHIAVALPSLPLLFARLAAAAVFGTAASLWFVALTVRAAFMGKDRALGPTVIAGIFLLALNAFGIALPTPSIAALLAPVRALTGATAMYWSHPVAELGFLVAAQLISAATAWVVATAGAFGVPARAEVRSRLVVGFAALGALLVAASPFADTRWANFEAAPQTSALIASMLLAFCLLLYGPVPPLSRATAARDTASVFPFALKAYSVFALAIGAAAWAAGMQIAAPSVVGLLASTGFLVFFAAAVRDALGWRVARPVSTSDWTVTSAVFVALQVVPMAIGSAVGGIEIGAHLVPHFAFGRCLLGEPEQALSLVTLSCWLAGALVARHVARVTMPLTPRTAPPAPAAPP